jgi:hypothetical protein
MIFWVAILAGALFAWFTFKLGFYDTLAMLFNIVIAIYAAIFLAPVIIDLIPAAGDMPAGNVLTLLALAVGIFLILHGISYTFITGQFNVSFPKLFDIVFAPLLGFLAGFLLLSFAAFLICVTPISQNKFAGKIGLDRHSQQTNISYICWWCDLVHGVTSSKDGPQSTEQAIDWYFNKPEEKTPEEPAERAKPDALHDANAPIPFNIHTNNELLSEINNDARQY